MLIKSITYKDYNGETRTEKFYFNLTRSELIEMDAMIPGGLDETFKLINEKNDIPALMNAFKTILMKSYGVKHADGRRFEKSEEISRAFEQSPAYDEFFMSLVTDNGENSSAFIRGILPEQTEVQNVSTVTPAPVAEVI